MNKTHRKRRYRRGYPVAILVGFESDHAMIWRVFSRVIKLSIKVELKGRRTEEKILYNFHERVVDALKPTFREGVKTTVVVSPSRTTYTKDFMEHVRKHHRYLIEPKSSNHTNFADLIGSADSYLNVTELVKTNQFKKILAETTSNEADRIVNFLEKYLYSTKENIVILYSLKEIEYIIYNTNRKNDFENTHLILTDQYLIGNKNKTEIHRLLQISKNKKVKTRIVDAETTAGTRISQLGGIVFFSTSIK